MKYFSVSCSSFGNLFSNIRQQAINFYLQVTIYLCNYGLTVKSMTMKKTRVLQIDTFLAVASITFHYLENLSLNPKVKYHGLIINKTLMSA